MEPAYVFNEFVSACGKGSRCVYVIKGAAMSANMDFQLKTNTDILGFIANNGLEQPKFINSKIWENNPDKNNKIMTDAYEFYTGSTLGYISFFYNNNLWIIKSFKKSLQPGIRNMAFSELKILAQNNDGGHQDE